MTYSFAVYKAAKNDISEAYNWYEKEKAGLGDEFLLELAACCQRINNYPLACQIRHKYFRQASLRRFPYVVVYEVFKKQIVVYSVFHTRQHPKKKYRKK